MTLSILIEAKPELLKILILALVGDLTYIYDTWAANPNNFILYRIIFERKFDSPHSRRIS